MTDAEKDFVLSLPREVKLDTLRDLVKEGSFSAYFEFVKMLLDAPITNGGIESDAIDAIFNEFKETGVDAAFARSEAKVIASEKK